MNDEDLKKILFVFYLLRNKVDGIDKEYAQEMIDLIEKHLGLV